SALRTALAVRVGLTPRHGLTCPQIRHPGVPARGRREIFSSASNRRERMRVFNNVAEYLAEKGKEIGVSDWVQIDQDRINKFADATGDHQWIHVDPARTQKELGMPTIAHGYL